MSAEHPSSAALGPARAPDLQGVVRRQWPVIALCALLAAAISVLYVSTSKVTYESRATVLLKALPGEVAPGGGLQRTLDVETQATVARSTQVLEAVGLRLGLTPLQVKGASMVTAAATGDVLTITFTDKSAEFAATGALAYTEEFLSQRKGTADAEATRQKNTLQSQIDTLQDEITDLTGLIEAQIARGEAGLTELAVLNQRQTLAIRDVATARDEIAGIDDDLEAGSILVDPRTAVSRTGLKVGFTVAGGFAVGLLIGIIVALLRDRRDDRYGSAIGLESLGIQEVGRIRYPSDTSGGRLESTRRAYARLLVRLNFSPGANPSGTRSILVLAVESVTLPNGAVGAVAGALAAEGPDNGLAAVVLGSERGRSVDAADENAPYWSTFVESLRQANRDNDIVIVTAGPFDRSVAGLSIASKVDEVVLLVSLATPVSELVGAIEDLESVEAHEIGVVVLTRVPSRRRW